MLFVVLFGSGAFSSTEEVLEFLLWEVNVIVSMGMGVLNGIVPAVLPHRVTAHIDGLTVLRGL